MRQKITWFIPGLLVTLLLGLLWAMPAFGAEAGEISFLDEEGGDGISFVSLNGSAAEGGFWVQIEDPDLDPIETISITNDTNDAVDVYSYAGVPALGTAAAPIGTLFAGETGYTWHDVQDSTNDDIVDNRDFTAYTYSDITAADGGTKTALTDVDFGYDRSNGQLGYTNNGSSVIHEIRFRIKKQTILGARSASDQTASFELANAGITLGTAGADQSVDDTALNTAFDVGDTTADDPSDDFNPDETLIHGDDASLSWVELLGSKVRDLTTRMIYDAADDSSSRTTVSEMQTELAGYIKAYNKGAPGALLSDAVAITVGTAPVAGTPSTLSSAGSSITVTISNSDATPDADTACVGLNKLATPTGTDTTNTAPLAADYDCDIDQDTGSIVVYEAVGVVVEVRYNGSRDTIYGATGRIGAEADVGRVTVDSSGASQSISVLLEETGSATGIFGANIMICEAGTEGCTSIPSQADETTDGAGMIMLPVEAAGDTITVSYRDGSPRGTRRATVALDPAGPSFNNLSPASGTAGREDEPTVSFEAVDGESGLSEDEDDADSVYVVAALYDLGDTESSDEVVYIRDDLDTDEVTNGFAASVTIDEGSKTAVNDRLDAGDRDEYEIRWWAVAVDAAGNVGVSDSDSDTACTSLVVNGIDELKFGAAQTETEAENLVRALEETIKAASGDNAATGCDANVIRVDSAKPELSLAETGFYLDGDEEKSSSTTSIVARFSEALDCTTVSADDFEVDGDAPNDATCKGSNVYLSVDELDSNDTPDVAVAEASVTDLAGNAIGADQEKEASDGIRAVISVTVNDSDGRVVTDEEITITVASDERMKGRPTVDIRKVGDKYALGTNLGGSATSTGNVNEWKYSVKLDDAGLYNVYVTAEDRAASGLSTAGIRPGVMGDHDNDPDTPDTESTADFTLNVDTVKSDDAILFEVDNAVSTPTFTPSNEGSTDNANAFIRIDFEFEGKEYGLSGDNPATSATDETGVATTSGTAIGYKGGASFDTHSTVTLVSATFNGDDVTDDVSSRDEVLFVYRPGNLTNGEQKFNIKVMDAAGNEDDFDLTFNKVDKAAFEIALNPGPNLVSFPAAPADGSIDAVFGGEGNEDIKSVLTYDNTSRLWQTAMKGSDGTFVGDLTTINGMNGYWVVSDGIVDVSVVLTGSGDVTSTPPHIAVTEGWNLIGVVDTEQRQDYSIATSDYFANIAAQVVYGYDSHDGKLVRLSTADEEDTADQDLVSTGAAYWVYANEGGIIIP